MDHLIDGAVAPAQEVIKGTVAITHPSARKRFPGKDDGKRWVSFGRPIDRRRAQVKEASGHRRSRPHFNVP